MEKKEMRIYLSGPIGNETDTEYPFRIENFRLAARKLRNAGYQVVSPLEVAPHPQSWEEAMRADIKALMDCTHIFMLPGWQKSRGATIENNLARNLKMGVFDNFEPVSMEMKGKENDSC